MELKLCPFCGANDAVETDMEGMRRTVYFVSCNKCGAAGPSRVYPDHSQPLTEADLWNRRAVPAPEQSDWERAERVWNEWSITEPLNRRNLYEFLASAFTQIRIEERERCAQVCEGMSQAFTPCADAIRGLK